MRGGKGKWDKGILRAANPLEVIMSKLSRTVLRDEVTKRTVFLTGLSAYTDEPINLFLRGPPSTGKSYVTVQTLRFAFPQEDVWYLGGLSPKALVHQKGDLIDEEGEVITSEQLEALDKDARRELLANSRYRVALAHKILVFLEAPPKETYEMLRPILSHDIERIEYRFTDKTSRGKLRTSCVVVQGWPATIFCTTEFGYQEDLTTRGLAVTPEMTKEKYRNAVRLIGSRLAFPNAPNNPESGEVWQAVQRVKVEMLDKRVLVPYGTILDRIYRPDVPGDMRHAGHLGALIKAHAALNVLGRATARVGDATWVLASFGDLAGALGLWDEIVRTTRSGVPGQILVFYDRVMLPAAEEAMTMRTAELVNRYREVTGDSISARRVREWLRELENVGLVDSETDPNDRRQKLYTVVKQKTADYGDSQDNAAKYGADIISELFSVKDFENWLKTLRKYIHAKKVMLYTADGEPCGDPAALYTTHLLPLYFSKEKGLILKPWEEKGAKKTASPQIAEIPQDLFDGLSGLDSREMATRRIVELVADRGEISANMLLASVEANLGMAREEAVDFLNSIRELGMRHRDGRHYFFIEERK